MKHAVILLVLVVLGGSAAAQSLTLSPAVVPLGGRPGQSTTQRLTLVNGTAHALRFALIAQDVVVREGARVFVDAGDEPGSIAATAVFSTRTLSLRPGEERAVTVTLTLPTQMRHRAVVILFQGTTRIRGRTTVSIGSLLTFDLAGRHSIDAGELLAEPPLPSANAAFSIPITNDGTEPAIVRGAAAILGARGILIGKISLDARRLLPGERTALRTDYPGDLPSGSYQVVATIASADRSWTRTTQLTVP